MSTVASDVARFLTAHRQRSRAPIPATPMQFDAMLRKGIQPAVVDLTIDILNIPRERMAILLHISLSTLDRRLKERTPFRGAEADALYRLLGVLGTAYHVLKTPENVRSWLSREQPGLSGKVPLELVETAAGAEAVTLLLEQIHHGIVS